MRNKIVKRVDEGELVCIYAHLAIVKPLSMKSLLLVLAISINQMWPARNDGTNRRYCISEDYRNVTEDGKEANDLGP